MPEGIGARLASPLAPSAPTSRNAARSRLAPCEPALGADTVALSDRAQAQPAPGGDTVALSDRARALASPQVRTLSVPLYDQHDGADRNACGTTSASMLIDTFAGTGRTHHGDLDARMRPFDLYGAPQRLADAIGERGFRVGLRTGADAETIRGLIDQGVPAIALIDPAGPGVGNGLHYVVVRGYETDAAGALSRVSINDPAGGQAYDMPWADFEGRWSNLALKGVPTTLDRVLVSAVPKGDRPVAGADGTTRSASSIALPGEGGPGITASGRPGLCLADGVVNVASTGATGNVLRGVGGLGQTLGGAVTAPVSAYGQAQQAHGDALQRSAALRWQQGGTWNRARAGLEYADGVTRETAGAAVETVSNTAAATVHGAGALLGRIGDGIESAGGWMGDVVGRWLYGG